MVGIGEAEYRRVPLTERVAEDRRLLVDLALVVLRARQVPAVALVGVAAQVDRGEWLAGGQFRPCLSWWLDQAAVGEQGAGEVGEGLEVFGFAVVAADEAAVAEQPGQAGFDDPAVPAES